MCRGFESHHSNEVGSLPNDVGRAVTPTENVVRCVQDVVHILVQTLTMFLAGTMLETAHIAVSYIGVYAWL